MSRLGKSLITDTELLSVDRIIAEIDAVEPENVTELAELLLARRSCRQRESAPTRSTSSPRSRRSIPRSFPRPQEGRASGIAAAVLLPALEAAGHEVVPVGREDPIELAGVGAAINFTRPDAVSTTVRRCLEQDVPSIIGTTGLAREELAHLGEAAKERSLALFFAPNFAVGAVLMMRFAAEARKWLPRAEIVELHHESKADAPSGTAKATADLLPGKPAIHPCACRASSPTRRCCSGARASCSRSATTRPRGRPTFPACCSRWSGCPPCRRDSRSGSTCR